MVGRPARSSLTASRIAALAAAVVSLCHGAAPANSPAHLSLQELGVRQPPNFTPLHQGETVFVRGVVSARVFEFPDYSLLAFQEGDAGGVLDSGPNRRMFDSYAPGDNIEVQGTVSAHAGLVTVLPSSIRVTGRRYPPSPKSVSPEALLQFGNIGLLIETEGGIDEIGDTTSGPYMLMGTSKGELRLFIPHPPGVPSADVSRFRVGDRVRVLGVAVQYCTTPPYNRWFELLVSGPESVAPEGRTWNVPPLVIAVCVGSGLLIALVLWSRERRLRSQRERLRHVYQLAERILSASSMEGIISAISESLPVFLGISSAHLYVYNRGTKALDAVAREGREPVSISLSSPPAGTHAGAVACFHYRTLLAIPDISRSPFPMAAGPGERAPKSLLFVPMLSGVEVVGVLELDQDDRARDFTADEQALAQHLGNQIGVAVRLLDQRSVQEQLFRTEKLAAVGRLISTVVNELQTPLASISEIAARAGKNGHYKQDCELIAAESQKASSIVSRLVSFATTEQTDARPVSITTLLHNLIEFRERDWKASGIRVRDLSLSDPVLVLGSQGQLEQAFLTLLIHAEQSLAESAEKTITITTNLIAKRLLVEIAFTAANVGYSEERKTVVAVSRGVLAAHGGEVRLIDKPNTDPRFEVELPLIGRERAAPAAQPVRREPARRATALLIEPDENAQRQLRDLLAARGYRVVPVTNADTGLDLAQRMRFDAAFCSLHAPGLNWVELSERLHLRVGAFVLLSDRYDPELAADFEGESRFVLPKPVQEADLERVLTVLDSATVKN